MQEESDELFVDKLLEAYPFAGDSECVRQRLRAKTSAMVGRRRTLRQSGLACLLVVAFGAGWFARTWLQSPSEVRLAEHPTGSSPPPSVDAVETLEQADGVVELTDFIASRTRLTPGVNSYEYWRNSGNQQLLDRNDLVGALRSYRRALNAATAAELQVADKNDTWLLSELKYDRQRNLQKELPHADQSL